MKSVVQMAPYSVDQLRHTIRRRRQSLGLGFRTRAAHKLAKKVAAMPEFQQSHRVAFYIAVEGELDCLPLIKMAWRLGKACYLPVINFASEPKTMNFVRYRPGDKLINNRYGIREPSGGLVCDIKALELTITPLVAFDAHNNRIGMGGGFYDRAFALKSDSPSVNMLGVAYQFQRVAKIAPNAWDVRLDKVVAIR